jgi:non-canonical (house-cleaning) NTP pyrophosphatase
MPTAPSAIVAIGTTRQPKVQAVERVILRLRSAFTDFLPGDLKLDPRSVDSGAPPTPTTTEATMRGAKNRAHNAIRALREDGLEPALGIGLEGGVASEGGAMFLESWAFATDGERGFFGGSGRIALPEPLAAAVFERGEDLGPAADALFQRQDVAGQEGTFGVLTHGMISREEAFARSMLHALAPFYNPAAYSLE